MPSSVFTVPSLYAPFPTSTCPVSSFRDEKSTDTERPTSLFQTLLGRREEKGTLSTGLVGCALDPKYMIYQMSPTPKRTSSHGDETDQSYVSK